MSDTYGEYTTVAAARGTDLGTTQTGDDGALLDYIRQVSTEIDDISQRRFYPVVETLTFDTPTSYSYELDFGCDLISITSLTNGNGNAIAPTSYNLYPLNEPTKRYLKLNPSKDTFSLNDDGYPDAAITLVGVTGYQRRDRAGWRSLTTLSSATINASVTSMTVPTGTVKAGQLLKIGSEFLYASAVTVGTTDTVTIVRGANGSTAASHVSGDAISYWSPGYAIETLCRNAAIAYYRLRSNPTGNSIIVDGIEYATPKDVAVYIDKKLAELGYKRPGIG